MSRSNDGLPMLPPWLSDSEVTQVGQQIDYEAPPVQNLPHDELIEDTPAPKRRFKRPAPEGDRSDAPGPRKEKRRKPWRRDKNDDHQVEEHADERNEVGSRTSRPGDQWSNPPRQLDGGRQSAPPFEQRPADYRPADRSPESGPADPYQSAPTQQPYRPGPDNSWQQGPAQTADRPSAQLPTRTPSEPPAEFQPLGPRPPQPPVDQQPISTEATVHLGPRSHPPAPPAPPQAPTHTPAPQTPIAPLPHASSPQTPIAPQPHASSPQIPLAPQPPQRHAPTPQTPIAPQPQPHASSPQTPIAQQPQPHASSPQTPIAQQPHASSPQNPIAPPQATSADATSTADRPAVSERASSQGGPDASSVDRAETPTAEPPSWLEGPRTAEGDQAEGRETGEGSGTSAGATPATAQTSPDATSNRTSGSQTSASAAGAGPAEAPPAWLAPADSANTPEQPTAQRPLPRLPDLPPPPSRPRASTDAAESVPSNAASDPASAPDADDRGAPSDLRTDSATGSPKPISSTPADDVAVRRPDEAPRSAQSGAVERAVDPNRAPASEGRPSPADSAVSATRGRHWLPSEGPDASADQVRATPADAAEARPQQAAPPAADGPVPGQPQNPHAAASPHTSGSEHPLPSQPVTGIGSGPEQARPTTPEQSWHTGQSAAESAVGPSPIAQPPRSFAAPVSESAPAVEPEAGRGGSQSIYTTPATHSSGFERPQPSQPITGTEQNSLRAPEHPSQAGPRGADQQGRPGPNAPQWQGPVTPGPEAPGPHHPAPMRAPSDQAPGPHGYPQAPGPMAPNRAPLSAPGPHAAPEYPSAPQHPVQPQHPVPPQHSAAHGANPPQQPAQPQQWGMQQQPPVPTPSLDNVPIRGRAAKKPAGSGWRKAVHHVSGGAINPGMSAEERRLQELVARIRQPVRGDYRIAVLSLKGGVGKTTTTMGLGSTFASIRGDRVIAVDANPDFGTLSQRVPLQTRSTVRDLLLDSSIQRYSDVRRHTSQATSRLEVLASERDPAASEAFNEDEYRAVARILQRFYNIILTDCGTGLMHSAMAGVLELAHSLVLISSPAIDGARSAAATLDWLSLHGHDHLVRNAVVVINSPRAGSPNVGIQQLREYFLSRCRAVHIIPFDQHMSEGAEIDLHRLHKQTKRAYVELAATVADDFATDHRRYRG
ncbi:MinD/ParA family ATP-binding protein [Nocardia cyriacigeorgica]|uniref:MinD/ParA family ATP-binding protein n=1 Tax=Nocardia cyriacigeorgica TaxID=135487 RepID=UPI002811D279|nr:AAA family ATPase [Nocardia cyriacigeorgica]